MSNVIGLMSATGSFQLNDYYMTEADTGFYYVHGRQVWWDEDSYSGRYFFTDDNIGIPFYQTVYADAGGTILGYAGPLLLPGNLSFSSSVYSDWILPIFDMDSGVFEQPYPQGGEADQMQVLFVEAALPPVPPIAYRSDGDILVGYKTGDSYACGWYYPGHQQAAHGIPAIPPETGEYVYTAVGWRLVSSVFP